MRKPTTREMSDAHEIYLAGLLDGRRSRGSGNQFNDQMDGRNDRYEQEHALCWDGKSTFAASIVVSRKMWEKAVEQSHGEIPMLALRFYDTYRLAVGVDLAVLDANVFSEILADARAYREQRS